MKKLLLILAFLILPVLSYSAMFSKVEYVNIEPYYDFSWEKFLDNNKYDGGNGKRQWKYGYKKTNSGKYLPKEPPKMQIPEYLINHPLISGEPINLDNAKRKLYSKKDAVRFIIFNRGGYLTLSGNHIAISDGRTYGVTKEGIYFPFSENIISHPFEDLADSLIVTIQTKCTLEKRNPVLAEQYYMLYIFCCKEDVYNCDSGYYAQNQNEIELGGLALMIFGLIKIFIICILALFCFALPAIVLLVIKRYTPEGSAIYKAISLVEWLIILVGGASIVRSISKK